MTPPSSPFSSAKCSALLCCAVLACALQCSEGWYGADCSIPTAATVTSGGPTEPPPPWLTGALQGPVANVVPAAHAGGPVSLTRQQRRPLIYVYDLPPQFMNEMIEVPTKEASYCQVHAALSCLGNACNGEIQRFTDCTVVAVCTDSTVTMDRQMTVLSLGPCNEIDSQMQRFRDCTVLYNTVLYGVLSVLQPLRAGAVRVQGLCSVFGPLLRVRAAAR